MKKFIGAVGISIAFFGGGIVFQCLRGTEIDLDGIHWYGPEYGPIVFGIILMFVGLLIAFFSFQSDTVKKEGNRTLGLRIVAFGSWFLALLVINWGLFGIRQFWLKIVPALMASGLITYGSKKFALARRLDAQNADELIAQDSRLPILFLRSFYFDSEYSKKNVPSSFFLSPDYWIDQHGPWSFEELLCKGLERIAPVVALGKPGVELPPLGAARKYVANHQWQSEFSRLAEKCQLVCAVISSSPGILWEIQWSVEKLGPQKILLVFPQPLESGWEEQTWLDFVDKTNNVLQKPLPKKLPKKALAVSFEADWGPRIHTGKPIYKNYRRIVEDLIYHG